MAFVIGLLITVIRLYVLVLIARMIISLILIFARDYRPTGAVVVVFESVMMVTDPPLKALRKVIPPLRIGQISFDLAFLVLLILLQVAVSLLAALA